MPTGFQVETAEIVRGMVVRGIKVLEMIQIASVTAEFLKLVGRVSATLERACAPPPVKKPSDS